MGRLNHGRGGGGAKIVVGGGGEAVTKVFS